jgi:Fe-S cluster assembly scaffold protein SufB
MDDAEIKYSTVQNWYPGDESGKGGVFNFVTKEVFARKEQKSPGRRLKQDLQLHGNIRLVS